MAAVASYGHVFVAEIVGTAIFCVIGLGSIANGLLPGTKGHGIGFLGISFCFGLGVFLPDQFIGHISGMYNPAVAIASAVTGRCTWKTFAVCVCWEMVGGVLGGFLVWLMYVPHFQPLEFMESSEETIYDCCDLDNNGVAIIKQELSEPAHRYASARTSFKSTFTTGRIMDDLVKHPMTEFWDRMLKKVSQSSVCASDVANESPKGSMNRLHAAKVKSMKSACGPSVKQRIAEDQEVKLTVFCTRPSIIKHYWLFCFWVEAFLTFLLTFGAFAITNRGQLIPLEFEAERSLYKFGLEPAMTGTLVFALLLCGGGMTGPALNLARDLGPRIVHWLLPIPGKGTSEWWYSWVPVVAPCVGAILGALFADAMENVHLY